MITEVLKESLKNYSSILFTIDVDISSEIGQSLITKYFVKLYHTFNNRLNSKSKLNNIINRWNSNFEYYSKYYIQKYNIDNTLVHINFDKDNKQNIKKHAVKITFNNIESEALLLIATDICKEFMQDKAYITDFNKNKSYIANGNDIDGENIEQKLKNAKDNLNNIWLR